MSALPLSTGSSPGLRRFSGASLRWFAEFVPTLIGLAAGMALTAALGACFGINPLELFEVVHKAAFGSMFALENTSSRSGPLMLTGLAVVIPARAGLIVLGGEGSLVLGGLAVAVLSLGMASPLPAGLGIVALLLVGAGAGALLMAAVGALRQFRGVNEVISSLLVVYIVQAVFDFLIEGALRDPRSKNFPATRPVPEELRIGLIPGFDANWGLVIGVMACLIAYVGLMRTTYGFASRIVGGNARAAQTLGLSVSFHVIVACMLCGALAGLAGAIEVLAVHGQASGALYKAGYGFTGVLVAFLARHHPLGVIPAAILIGGLSAASGLIQRTFDVPGSFMLVVQGLVFVCILAAETLRDPIRKRLWREQP